jgi:Tfp pilus assembly protein PilN
VIRTNLSTRPFYNERAVQLVLLAVAVVALAATLFNVTRILGLSRQDTRLATQAVSDEARARDLVASASRRRATIDPKAIELASIDARQANDLIDRRTLSWTDLFNRLEMTLPDDVRITSVRPRLEPKRGTVLSMVVTAKSVDDVNRFVENLEATGAFAELEKRDERIDPQDQFEVALEGIYLPAAPHLATPPATEGKPR